MNNDNDLNLHSMTKLSGWLRYCTSCGKAVDILQQTCYNKLVFGRIRSLLHCRQSCCRLIVKTCHSQACCKLSQQVVTSLQGWNKLDFNKRFDEIDNLKNGNRILPFRSLRR